MNPLLSRLQPYPFERLRALMAGVAPPAASSIRLSIGEPQHPTPDLVRAALVAHLDGLATNAALLERFLLYRTYHGCAMSPAVQHASIAAWSDETHVRDNRAQYRTKFAARRIVEFCR